MTEQAAQQAMSRVQVGVPPHGIEGDRVFGTVAESALGLQDAAVSILRMCQGTLK